MAKPNPRNICGQKTSDVGEKKKRKTGKRTSEREKRGKIRSGRSGMKGEGRSREEERGGISGCRQQKKRKERGGGSTSRHAEAEAENRQQMISHMSEFAPSLLTRRQPIPIRRRHSLSSLVGDFSAWMLFLVGNLLHKEEKVI